MFEYDVSTRNASAAALKDGPIHRRCKNTQAISLRVPVSKPTARCSTLPNNHQLQERKKAACRATALFELQVVGTRREVPSRKSTNDFCSVRHLFGAMVSVQRYTRPGNLQQLSNVGTQRTLFQTLPPVAVFCSRSRGFLWTNARAVSWRRREFLNRKIAVFYGDEIYACSRFRVRSRKHHNRAASTASLSFSHPGPWRAGSGNTKSEDASRFFLRSRSAWCVHVARLESPRLKLTTLFFEPLYFPYDCFPPVPSLC